MAPNTWAIMAHVYWNSPSGVILTTYLAEMCFGGRLGLLNGGQLNLKWKHEHAYDAHKFNSTTNIFYKLQIRKVDIKIDVWPLPTPSKACSRNIKMALLSLCDYGAEVAPSANSALVRAYLNSGGAISSFTRANLTFSGAVFTRISNWPLRSLK